MGAYRFRKLGGKDPAYVAPDANLNYTVGELVDGESFFFCHLSSFDWYCVQVLSSIQDKAAAPSRRVLCTVERQTQLILFQRIYVHESIYEEFVKKFVEITKVSVKCNSTLTLKKKKKLCWVQTYKLGDPTLSETNLGPVVSLASAERIRKQIADAGMNGQMTASL